MVNIRTLLMPAILFFFMFSVSSAHEWMAPKKEAAVKNPLKKTKQTLETGQKVYSEFCIVCHGKDAIGLAPSVTGLERRTPDLQKTKRSHSDGDFFWKIKTGRNEMPSFKEELEDDEIWSVIYFIKSTK